MAPVFFQRLARAAAAAAAGCPLPSLLRSASKEVRGPQEHDKDRSSGCSCAGETLPCCAPWTSRPWWARKGEAHHVALLYHDRDARSFAMPREVPSQPATSPPAGRAQAAAVMLLRCVCSRAMRTHAATSGLCRYAPTVLLALPAPGVWESGQLFHAPPACCAGRCCTLRRHTTTG